MPSSIGPKKNHNINGFGKNTGKPIPNSTAFVSDPCEDYGFGNGMRGEQTGGGKAPHDDRDSFPTSVDQCSSEKCETTHTVTVGGGGDVKGIKANATISYEYKKERICTPKEDRKKKEDPPKETPNRVR